MQVPVHSYLDHFDQFGCKYYRTSETKIDELDHRDEKWLTQAGLPDGAIPFFFFDFYIAVLRDLNLEGAKMVLGTAFEPASHHYLYLDAQDEVRLIMENKHRLFVNSSIRQLCTSIYLYSNWLEEQEVKFRLDPAHNVDETEMFELYYLLREADKRAFEADNALWPQIVNSKVDFQMELV